MCVCVCVCERVCVFIVLSLSLSQASLFPAALVYFGSDVRTGLLTSLSSAVQINDINLICFTGSTQCILGNGSVEPCWSSDRCVPLTHLLSLF